MKKIYILLMHTKTIPSRLVKVFTKYEYSHVAISLTKDCYKTYSFGRRSLYNILNGGLSIQQKDGKFFKKFNKTVCKIYELEVTDEQYEDLKKTLDDMEKTIDNYKYDFLGIVPRWFGKPVSFKDRFVCSYFVAHILQEANICTFSKDTCLIVPSDFEKLEKIKEIYNGSYLEY
ncbi:MAG: hypothetical protein IJ272_07505 [Clostridia bacterium]|nr:hypothetical protein [Clostridia bacterium]